MIKNYNVGEVGELKDGRRFKFVTCPIECLDNPCQGCIFEDSADCGQHVEETGYCSGFDREDELNGIFMEVKDGTEETYT